MIELTKESFINEYKYVGQTILDYSECIDHAYCIMEEQYTGIYNNIGEYTKLFCDNIHNEDKIPTFIKPFIDYEELGKNLIKRAFFISIPFNDKVIIIDGI
jgi:hypothetical protein